MKFLNQLIQLPFIILIRGYQIFLSPILGSSKCRYDPTCSHYMLQAIREWGIFKGIFLGIKRILRCHPWSNHDHFDPIPKRKR